MSSNISSLDQLLEKLPNCSGKDYVKLAKNMSISKADLAPYIFWEKEFYTRNCIARTEEYELILLCWDKGQDTPIHCHGGQECWVHVVEGEIKECRYNFDEATKTMEKDHEMTFHSGGLSYMSDDMGFHALTNTNSGRSISLHLYMNPIDSCNIYDQDQERFIPKNLEYYSKAGVVLQPA